MIPQPTKVPFTHRRSFIAAVGAAVTAGVALAAHALGWSGETVALVLAVVGAVLAVWRSGTSPGPPDRRGGVTIDVLQGLTSLGLLLAFVLLVMATGCAGVVETHAQNSVRYDLWKRDCRMVVTADGAEVFVLTSDPAVQCQMVCHGYDSGGAE